MTSKIIPQNVSQYLTPEEVKEFQKLVFKTKKIKLTNDEALDQGTRLIMLMEAMQKSKIQASK